MAKLTLTDLTSLANDTSAVNTINANNALIETAMDTAVFRTGATPNAMTADLDLGSNYLLNVKSPNNNTDGANKAYVDSLLSGTTDTGAAQLRVDLASTANTEGASLIGVEDGAGNFTGTNVETVLAEVDDKIDTHITDLASTSNAKGAGLIGIEDAVSAFTGTDVEAVTNEIFDKSRYLQYAYLVASGTDTYTATPSPALSAYTTGETYRINFANANTSVAPTLNINAIGAKTLKDIAGNALVAGAINGEHIVSYNGTDMILLNPRVVTSITVTNYISSDVNYIYSKDDISPPVFDVDAVIGASWESVGPTGSGATNIWTALDAVPDSAKAITVRTLGIVTRTGSIGCYTTSLSSRVGGFTHTFGAPHIISYVTGCSETTGNAQTASLSEVTIPVSSAIIFDLYLDNTGSSTINFGMYLIGFSI